MRATNLANEFADRGYAADILVTGEVSDECFISLNKNVRIISIEQYNASFPLPKSHLVRKEIIIRLLKRINSILFSKRIKEHISFRIKLLRAGEELRSYFINNSNCSVVAFGAPYIKESLASVKGLGCNVFYAGKTAPEREISKESKEFSFYIYLLKRTKAVIVQTGSGKKYFNQYIDNVFVINNPIKPSLPLPKTESCGRKKSIVNFCRLSPEKNLELLLTSFEKLHSEYTDYYVEIYGNIVSDTEERYKDKINQMIIDKGMSDCVTILPPSADVHNRILDASMFVSTSNFEGLSNSMIEAMAIGLPCICTDCLGGGTCEVMTDYENGLIVPTNDPDALYRAMKEYIDNPELAEKCSRNAVAIRERLDVKRIADQWLDVIENV